MFHKIARFSAVRPMSWGDDHESDPWDAFETAQRAGVDCDWNDADALAASVCESAGVSILC